MSDVLRDLGEAVARFADEALEQLSDEARACLAIELEEGGKLAAVIDLCPYCARLVLHRPGERPITVAALVGEGIASGATLQ